MISLRRRNHSTIRRLRDEVNTLRMDLQNVTPADKLLLRTTLQRQRDILLPFQGHIPEVNYVYKHTYIKVSVIYIERGG